MVDQIRTKAQILTDINDNNIEDISPQNIRNLLISYLVFGEIGMIDNTTEQTALPAGMNVVPLDQAAPSQGVTANTVDNRLEVEVDGQYRVTFEASYKGSTSSRFTLGVLKNGSVINRSKRRDTPTDVAEERNIMGSCTIDLTPLDNVQLGVQVQPAGGNFTFISGGLRIERID